MRNGYHQAYAAWKRDPEAFWREAASDIDWFKPAERIFTPNEGVYGRWFSDAETNTCHNCLDRHVAAGRGGETAVIFDSTMNGEKRRFTYDEVLREVMAIAAALVERGIGKGDRVILYMPMVPQAVFSMLACARIGAVHSVVFGGFAASELAARIDDCAAKLVITASCGLEPGRIVAYKPLVDQAIEIARSKPECCLVLQRPELRADLVSGRDHDFEVAVAQHRGDEIACVSVKATDPLYILYTSGTTGQPKGVVRDNGGHMVALNWSMRNIYGLKPGEVFWTASDIGWVVGHSYIVYAPLLSGVTTLIFEGKPVGTPDAGTFWRIVSEYQVRVLFTAPTAFRAIRREDGEGELMRQYPMPDLRALFLAGALPVKHGSPALPMPGYDIAVLDDAGHPIEAGTLGNIVVKLPLPPGCLPTLWNADERFRSAYLDEFPGYYKTADAGYVDEDGYLFIMSRTDDIINCAGHRLSTGAMEEVCARHPDVAECAVIGVIDALKGQAPCGFLVLKRHVSRDATAIESEVVAMIRDSIGPVAAFKTAITVNRLPKTRSGKILRGTMQKIADGIPWKMPATIDDPMILEEIAEALRGRGLGSLPM
ncbi:AMP-binding protein [Rhizobium leguminosarum]|uniref:AMP-binding protein n=1 Tax=Rhizobium leguminosarum TaxID=384 RepID=UPI001C96C265|nr:AMP-binding protein [Rhizobium leguminosarum]MBY5564829.1 propionyl-CoA synthetase [Rhizobium leguminosarum]MBY5714047.1 propionyl-CoA synthetase [Rhizobium leguminosarum]